MERVTALLLHDVYRDAPAESGFAGAGADRYKLAFAEFDAQLRDLARCLNGAARTDSPWVDADGTWVAFTVDDGGVSYHSVVADRLEALGLRGYCMVTTDFIGRPGFLEHYQLRDLAARGHVIGTHSVTHPARFSTCTWGQMVHEWADSRAMLEDLLGRRVTVGSVPGGSFSRRVAAAADAAGLRRLFTSEPITRVEYVGDCQVIGRFTIRPGRPGFAAAIARRHSGALLREWASWNTKKLIKQLLGAAYPRLADEWQRALQRS